MFQKNPALSEFVEKLMKACAKLKRDDYLRHSQITKILGVPPHTEHWQACINKLKLRLEHDRGITLWSERKVGYKLLSVQDQLTIVPGARLRRADRQISRGEHSVSAAPDAELSDHQRRIKQAQSEGMERARQTVQERLRQQRAICTPYENNPRMAETENNVA